MKRIHRDSPVVQLHSAKEFIAVVAQLRPDTQGSKVNHAREVRYTLPREPSASSFKAARAAFIESMECLAVTARIGLSGGGFG
jgi:hypothetical protein